MLTMIVSRWLRRKELMDAIEHYMRTEAIGTLHMTNLVVAVVRSERSRQLVLHLDRVVVPYTGVSFC